MPITVACRCGKRYSLQDNFAGKRVRCKACGAVMQVPALPAAPPGPATEPGEWDALVDRLDAELTPSKAENKSLPTRGRPRPSPQPSQPPPTSWPRRLAVEVGMGLLGIGILCACCAGLVGLVKLIPEPERRTFRSEEWGFAVELRTELHDKLRQRVLHLPGELKTAERVMELPFHLREGVVIPHGSAALFACGEGLEQAASPRDRSLFGKQVLLVVVVMDVKEWTTSFLVEALAAGLRRAGVQEVERQSVSVAGVEAVQLKATKPHYIQAWILQQHGLLYVVCAEHNFLGGSDADHLFKSFQLFKPLRN